MLLTKYLLKVWSQSLVESLVVNSSTRLSIGNFRPASATNGQLVRGIGTRKWYGELVRGQFLAYNFIRDIDFVLMFVLHKRQIHNNNLL